MEQRYNYFQQNPNSLLNGQSTFNRSSTADVTQSTTNYSGSISSTSSQDQSPFHERMHTNSNAVPLMNNHLYQMDSSNQPPLSSGPPRTNAKGIYENPLPSIPNVLSLAQNNAENYPIVPDFQLQPHLTGLLPQQLKRVPELYPVDQYSNNTSKGSIATHMNPNYFSSNKSYPEPKIIEYDMEETSTESSPQHTSSLYSESTDQDSESTHPGSVFPRHTSFENTECHITKESKTIPFSNQEFPVPSQFADLSLNRDDNVDDHQHSILHNAYNQDDIIEDIPLTDNINQNEIESSIGNQENPKLQISEQGFSSLRTQTFDYHDNKKDFGQTEFKYENRHGSPPSISNNKTNYSPYNVYTSSNTQNPSQISKELLISQSNILSQPSSLNNSMSQPSKPPSNIELFNRQHESQSVQNYNDIQQLGGYSQHNKYIQPVIQNSSVSLVDSKQQFNYTNNYDSQDKRSLNQCTSQAQKLHDMNNYDSNTTNLYSQQRIQDVEPISQQPMSSSPKSPVSEFLNDGQPITSQCFTTYSSSLTSTQSISSKTSAAITDTTLRSSSSVSEAIVQENQNTSDDQTSGLFNLSDVDSPIDSINEDTNKVKSEFDVQLSQFPCSSSVENQQETIVDQSESSGVQSNEIKPDNLKSQPIEQIFPVKIQPSTQLDSNNLQPSFNQFASQQRTFDNNIKTSNDQFSNSPINLVSHSINTQRVSMQESKPTQSYSVGRYFDSVNASNQSEFRQETPNIQSHNQQQTVGVQDVKPIISSFASDKSNNLLTFSSNTHNSSIQLASSNQQSLQMKKEVEITENLSPEKTISLQSTKSDSIKSNNLNVESLNHDEVITQGTQATENMTTIDQFSHMSINNQQNVSVNQTYSQEQTTSVTSYFSKGTSLDNEDNIAFKNFSTLNTPNNATHDSSEVNNTHSYLKNKQTNPQFLISNQQTDHQITPLPINNQNVLEEKPNLQLVTNQFSSQQFNHKVVSSSVPSVTMASNQLPPQMFSNQAKSGAVVSPPTPGTSQNPTQFSNQSMQNVVSSQSNQFPPQVFSNEPKSSTVSSLQSTSNLYAKQPLSNQPQQNMIPPVSPAVNQFPPQNFSNPKLNTVPSNHSSSTSYLPQPSNNQPNLSTVLPVSSSGINQYPSQIFSNQSKSDILQSTSNSYPTQMLNKQSPSTTISPTLPDVNQFPQQLNNQQKSGSMPPFPTTMNQNVSNLFGNLTKPTTEPVVINQFPSNLFNGPAKSEIMPPLQTTDGYPVQTFNNQSTQNSVQSISSVSHQLPPQAYGNPLKSSIMPPLQPAVSQYPSQSLSNQPTLNTVPIVSSSTKQLPSQMSSNQSKSDGSSLRTTFSQYPSQSFNDQSKSNMTSLETSVANQLPTQMSSNQPRLDIGPPLQSTTSQYPSQPFNNQPIPNTFPPVALASNQLPPQMFNNQAKLNAGPSNKPMSNRYPSQPLSNQPLSGVPPTQLSTNQYPSQPLSNQSIPNPSLLSQPIINQYPSQPFSNQPGQVLSNLNQQPSQSNQFYNQTNLTQPTLNQWPTRPGVNQQSATPVLNSNFSNQNSLMFTQPSILNKLPLNVNQQTQGVGSQILPPNPNSNNYYNQVQGNLNVQQSQPPAVLPGQNVPLASKGYPQQNNMGFSSQINYQQPNAIRGQQGFLNQSQEPGRPEQNPSVVQQGFAKTWGYDNLDLLKSRDVLPGDGVHSPEIKLPEGYANCDNCSPDIFRCTLNKFPSSKNLLDKSRLPLGILIHPYKDLSRLTVIQCETITRCRNCRSYINPFVQFIDNAHWKCNLCYRVNELPGEFQIDPYTKTLGDPSRRPEIQNATIEYIASQDYMVRPPQPALYLFLLDVSRTATLTGYLEIVCDRILNKILADDIPGDSRTNIGFITYDSAVHFYQIANNDGGQPKQLIVSDISDIFLPLPDGLMVNLEENKSAVKDLLTSLPNLYRESYNTGCALGAALQAAFKILAPRGGRVTVFQACLPNVGPGSLQQRDDGNVHTGDRVQHMAPSTDFYKKLALECSAEQIAVDLFFVSSQYLDIATVSGISKYSAGCIHNFPQFDVKSPTIVTRFINCFDRYLTRKIGFEALLRLRCTRGVAIHSFHGNFFVRSSDLLMLPNVNPDNAYGMQLSIDDSLDGLSVVCFQAALLYTSSNAERRIRVHTLCIPVTDNLNDVFHNADQQAITCLIAKMAVDRSTEKSLSDAREAFFNAISDSLSAFKLGCSSYSGPGTMLAPLSLKVFPLYILATLKHAAFRINQPTRLDERMFSMCQMKSLPLISLIQYLYPDLYPIHALEEQPKIDYEKLTEIPLPPVIQLSAERVESNGIYLMDDGETLTIFIGHRCSDQLIQKLFGYVNASSMPELITTLAEVDSKPSYLLRSFIAYLQHFKPYALPLEIIKDNGPHKLRFYSRLVEDKFESSLSYYEFLQRLSQQVR